MKYAEVLARFYGEPLAMLPEKIEAVARFLRTKAAGLDVPEAEVAAATRGRPGPTSAGATAVIPVMGVISQRVSLLEQSSGGIGCDRVGAQLDAAVRDPDVKSVVLAFDSPGGSVFGVAELAAKIRAARDQKRVVGLADSMAASAAYWLLAQCAEVWCAPGGQVGSIGVYCAHEDCSKAAEMEGVATTLVSAGKYKVEGNPYGPLTEEARAEMQAKVDAYYSAFVGDVAKGRGVSAARVGKDFGQGRMLLADDAKQAGMVDRVGTLAELLARLGGPAVTVGAAAARARAVGLED